MWKGYMRILKVTQKRLAALANPEATGLTMTWVLMSTCTLTLTVTVCPTNTKEQVIRKRRHPLRDGGRMHPSVTTVELVGRDGQGRNRDQLSIMH